MRRRIGRFAGRILGREGVELAGFGLLVFGAYSLNEVAGVFVGAGVLIWYGNRGG